MERHLVKLITKSVIADVRRADIAQRAWGQVTGACPGGQGWLGRGLNAGVVDKAEKQERELPGEAGCVGAGGGDGPAFEEPRRVGWDMMRARS